MLKFPRIEGPMLAEIRAELVGQIPPPVAAQGDADRAFQAAVDAVNAAFEVAAVTLNTMDDSSSAMITRSMAMIMFMQLMEAQIGAAKGALTSVLARLAIDDLIRATVVRAEAARSTRH